MIGGSTNNSTKSGAKLTVGSPGTSARTTPLITKRIAGGIFSRNAATETAAMTVSSKIRICTVIIGEPTVHSNKGFEEWGEILGDEVMAGALIDRLMHHCHVVNIRGNSYRMREHTDLWHAISSKNEDQTTSARRLRKKEAETH